MNASFTRRATSLAARTLQRDHMRLLGIANTMRLAGAFSRLKYRRQHAWRRELYDTRLDELLDENGPRSSAPIELRDGWCIDTSMNLPHIERVLEDSERIIAERGGNR